MVTIDMAHDDALREVPFARETIYDGHILHVEKWRVTCPNGREAPREIVVHKGAAAVVPVFDNGDTLLVRQHRVAVDRVTLEIPAGKLDGVDEDPFVCAQRELSEETGLTADHWRKLTVLETTPGFCNERIHLYLATGLHAGKTHPDEDEFVCTLRMPLSDAVQKVMDGTFRDGKTALALLMVQQLLSAPCKQ